MVTGAGVMHVKFASQQREGPYAPANEALAVAILEILGVTRAKRWLVDIPEALVAASSELVDITSRIGLGTEWVDEYSPDISGAQIAVAGKNAPKDELLAQHVVINWLQVGDHSHNFVTEGDRLLAVDFASGPNVQVWNGDAPHGEVVSDEAGLAPLLAGLDQETCRSVASLHCTERDARLEADVEGDRDLGALVPGGRGRRQAPPEGGAPSGLGLVLLRFRREPNRLFSLGVLR
jgi:hypothetical protein